MTAMISGALAHDLIGIEILKGRTFITQIGLGQFGQGLLAAQAVEQNAADQHVVAHSRRL